MFLKISNIIIFFPVPFTSSSRFSFKNFIVKDKYHKFFIICIHFTYYIIIICFEFDYGPLVYILNIPPFY